MRRTGSCFPDMESEWSPPGFLKVADVAAAAGGPATPKKRRTSGGAAPVQVNDVLARKLAESQLRKIEELKKETKKENE